MNPPPPSRIDAIAGYAFWLGWRLVGLWMLPFALLHPKLRPHVWRVPHPDPGWTWLHGASHGEHVAARALADALPTVWRTSSSPRTQVEGALPAPADLPFVAERWLDDARPGRLILVESELWPGWLIACRRRGIPVAVVQARPSRGWQRWQSIGPVWRWLMHGVEVIPQADVGDLKQAGPSTPSPRPLAPGAILLASSRPGDEAWVLDAWQGLRTPRPRLVIAPRHLDRCAEVTELVHSRGLSLARRSGVDSGESVLLIDTFGELSSLFSGAGAAVIGGTLDPTIGGHAPSEAIRAGVPVVAGPHRHANPAAWATAALFSADATPSSLRAALAAALQAPSPGVPPSNAVSDTIARLPPARVPGTRARYPLLWPLVPLVHGIGRLRPAWWQSPVQVAVPVVSVGALTAGGSGKTPLAGWLAAQLPGAWVVARGHRRGGGPAVRVGHPHQAPVHELGDELEMLRRRGIPVVSAPDRVAGARAAIAEGARCIVLDDGFQHRRLHRDVDIVCIDTRWPRGRGPIPVGTAREPWSALQRADLLVCLGDSTPAGLPDRPCVQARLAPESTDHLPEQVDLAVGIARPSGVLSTLISRGHMLRSLVRVRDHGRLPPLPGGCVVTEKDAARLPASADVRVLRVRMEVSNPAAVLSVLRAAGIPVEPPGGYAR